MLIWIRFRVDLRMEGGLSLSCRLYPPAFTPYGLEAEPEART